MNYISAGACAKVVPRLSCTPECHPRGCENDLVFGRDDNVTLQPGIGANWLARAGEITLRGLKKYKF
jgi:hypothetical protein